MIIPFGRLAYLVRTGLICVLVRSIFCDARNCTDTRAACSMIIPYTHYYEYGTDILTVSIVSYSHEHYAFRTAACSHDHPAAVPLLHSYLLLSHTSHRKVVTSVP